ncbi:MAG: hypothetical protein IH961_10820, partial [Chloroflexi bacterium]|nr:hypothetical protein [Chloroflexota bacterium]
KFTNLEIYLDSLTPTEMKLPSVGGIALDSDARTLPLETTGPDSSLRGVAVAIVVVACVAMVAAWYVRKRLPAR